MSDAENDSEAEKDAIRRAVKQMPGYKETADPQEEQEAWEAWYEYVKGFGGLETFLATAEARILSLKLPVEIAGCELRPGPPSTATHDIQSRGPLGGKHGTLFDAQGDTAAIIGIGKTGWLGYRQEHMPIESHVQVLRELGFKDFVLPSGKRYEIRTWPGVRRIHD